MIKTVSALLLGASLVAAAPASAAIALNLSQTGTATGYYNPTATTPASVVTTNEPSGFFAIVLPNSAVGTSGFVIPVDPSTRGFSVSANSQGLTITSQESRQGAVSGFQFDINIFVCGDFSGGIPGSTVAVDSSCSTASAMVTYPGASAGSPVRLQYTGNITGLTVSNVASSDFGVAVIPSVPEPASWAMMLMGFAAMGVVLRRRSPTVRPAGAC